MPTLGIAPHMRCVAECRHCGFESSRKDTRVLPDDVVRRLVAEACAEPEVTTVAFYGGEPLLRADFVIEMCCILRDHNKPTWIYTNGFWGITEKAAQHMLERLRDAGVSGITTSADNYHWEYIPRERVKNVLRAHRHVPEVAITLMTVDSPSHSAEAIREELGDLLEDVHFLPQGLVGIGNARNLPESEFTNPYTTFDDLPCLETGLNFSDIGPVTPCPALESIIKRPDNQGVTELVSLGKSDTQTVRGALDAMQKPAIRVLTDHGPSWFVAKFREAGIPEFQTPEPVSSACELCVNVFRNPAHFEAIKADLDQYVSLK